MTSIHTSSAVQLYISLCSSESTRVRYQPAPSKILCQPPKPCQYAIPEELSSPCTCDLHIWYTSPMYVGSPFRVLLAAAQHALPNHSIVLSKATVSKLYHIQAGTSRDFPIEAFVCSNSSHAPMPQVYCSAQTEYIKHKHARRTGHRKCMYTMEHKY